MTSSSLDILIRQQDYFWFLAVIGFAVVLVLSLRAQNRIQSWSWLPWFAGGNLVIVFIELVRLSQPLQMDPRIPPSLHLDLWLGSILAAQVWSLVGFCCRPVTAAAWAIAAALLAWLRLDHPWSATLTLALLGTGAFAWLHRARAVRPPFALLAMGLTSLWLSPVGPLTCGLNNQLINRLYPVWVANAPAGGALNHLTVGLRRWSIPGSWGLWVSLTFLLAAGISVWVLTVRLPRERERQEWKRFASLAIVWLVSGIFSLRCWATGRAAPTSTPRSPTPGWPPASCLPPSWKPPSARPMPWVRSSPVGVPACGSGSSRRSFRKSSGRCAGS